MLYELGKFLTKTLLVLVGHLRVIGRENVPATGGIILAANHTSYADPPIVGVGVKRPVWFMGKAELFAIPVLGPIIRRVHAFPVKRGSADRAALRYAHELLQEGKAVTIFFEGGRSPDGKLLPPALGPAMVALRANVPIVPIAIIDADHFMPREGGLKFARVTVVYGKPLSFPHLAGKSTDRAALEEVSRTVAQHVADLLRAHGAGDRVPPGYLLDQGCKS